MPEFGLSIRFTLLSTTFLMDSHSAPIAADDVFQAADVAQFQSDDTEAGQAICKMLSLMFAYTVFAMTVTTLVTIYWTSK